MGVLKVPSLLFLMLLLLAPASDAETCKEASESYTTIKCRDDACAKACQLEGFIDGTCEMVWAKPVFLRCFCNLC
ncbi:hypothetical protein VPH35_103276 [Triticum aestivum]|uniref:Knottins-like domain-containing protein n=1 Tax=Triticum urartu TaxID=4572 RepID=A0A8R7QKI4_TRIUA